MRPRRRWGTDPLERHHGADVVHVGNLPCASALRAIGVSTNPGGIVFAVMPFERTRGPTLSSVR